MKKLIFTILFPLLFLASCSSGMQGDPGAINAGAAIGGMVGAIIGDRAGGYNGSQFGALLGTVTGAVVGNAITTPKQETYNNDLYNQSNNYIQSPLSNLQISNIRFIDNGRNRIINPEEDCKIVFDISNNGEVAAYNITPIIKEITGVKNIQISPSTQISYMAPGNVIRYTATVRSGKRLKSGNATFQIYTIDSTGANSEKHEFSIPTLSR